MKAQNVTSKMKIATRICPDTGTESSPIIIIDIGGEGGSIALFGWKDDHSEWHFLRETDERTLMNMMPEDDQEGICFYSETESVVGWSEALKLLNRYPWPCLYPLYVHPEFSDLVFCELKNTMHDVEHIDFGRWAAVCAGSGEFAKG